MSQRRLALVSPDCQLRVNRALRCLSAIKPGTEALLLGETRSSVDELAMADAQARGSSFGLHRKTLSGFAAERAAETLAREGISLAPRLALETLAREVIEQARKQGKLPILSARPLGISSAAEAPSLPLCLVETFDELRLAGIDLDAQVGERSVAEVLLLARELAASLAARGLADRATVLSAAIRSFQSYPLRDAPLLGLDLCLGDALPQQWFKALVEASGDCMVVIPRDDPRTLACLEQLDFEIEHIGPTDPLALSRLKRDLFAVDRTPTAQAPDESVSCFGAPGEALEAAEVARALLQLAKEGVAFDRMAVAVRSHATYAEELAATFARAGIPAHFEGELLRPDPAGRALLSLLCCKLERGSGRRLAEYLSLGQTPRAGGELALVRTGDESLGRFGEAAASAATEGSPEPEQLRLPSTRRWERILGEAGVTFAQDGQGIAAYVSRRLAAARAELDQIVPEGLAEGPERDRLAREAASFSDIEARLLPILGALDAIPFSGSHRELVEALGKLAAAAVAQPERIASLLAELLPFASDEQVELQTLVDSLGSRLKSLPIAQTTAPAGHVLVTRPESLRGRFRDYVAIVGLSERMFPERHGEDPLLLDAARESLFPQLRREPDRAMDERLLLRLAIGAAKEKVALSFSSFDTETSRARVPSLYLLEALDVALGATGGGPFDLRLSRAPSGIRLAWPAPRSVETAIDESELALAFLAELRTAGESAKGRGRVLVLDHPHVLRALRTRYRRLDSRRFSHYDGFYASGPRGEELISLQSLKKRPYSPSALQDFASCPYRFYLRSIARLSPRQEAHPADSLDHLLRGTLYHACQAQLARAQRDRGLSALEPKHEAPLAALITEIVSEQGARFKARVDPLFGEVFARELGEIERDISHDLTRRRVLGDRFLPVASELGFGVSGKDLDPRSTLEPARVADDFLLRGVVDQVEKDGAQLLRITDFKTGRNPESVPGFVIGGGRLLQPLLYALAVESLRERGFEEGSQVSLGRLYYATERGGYSELSVSIDDDARGRGKRALRLIDDAVSHGILLTMPAEKACKQCDFRPICGPNEERRWRQKRPRNAEEKAVMEGLKELRGMP